MRVMSAKPFVLRVAEILILAGWIILASKHHRVLGKNKGEKPVLVNRRFEGSYSKEFVHTDSDGFACAIGNYAI